MGENADDPLIQQELGSSTASHETSFAISQGAQLADANGAGEAAALIFGFRSEIGVTPCLVGEADSRPVACACAGICLGSQAPTPACSACWRPEVIYAMCTNTYGNYVACPTCCVRGRE